MKVFLKVSQHADPNIGFTFNNHWLNAKVLKGFYFIEIDNYSEKYLVQQIARLIDENEVIVILLELKQDTIMGNIPFLFRKIIRHKKKIVILSKEQHQQINALLKPFFCIKNYPEITNNYLIQLIENIEST